MRLPAAIVFLVVASLRPGLAASVEDWRTDIDAVVHDVETVHPNAFTRTDRRDFLAKSEALKVALPSLTEEQRMVGAMRLVALIGDGHTQLMPNRPDFAWWYPVRLYQFTDGYFFTAAYKTDVDLVGAELLRIAGRPVDQVMADVRSLMNNETPLDYEEHLIPFHSAPLMKGLGYADVDGSLEITVRLRDGRIQTRKLMPHRTDDPRYRKDDSTLEWRFSSEIYGPPFGKLDDWTTAYKGLPTIAYRTVDKARPPHFVFRRPFVALALPDSRTYYIQLNSIGDWDDKTFEQFFRNALAEVDRQKPDALIVDMRYNPGGDGSKVRGMIHQFIKREDNLPWKHFYVLTGRKTFSAALIALAAFIGHTRMSIVGEPPGEPLNADGDPTDVDFPHAGMELQISTMLHKLEDSGENDPMMPVDVPAPFSFADYAAGRDPAVDAILRGDDMRSIPIIALESGGTAARKAFEDRKQRYARYKDWMHIREVDLLHGYWALEDAHRQADMLELARIMVELYPRSALSWSKLGDAQIANGQESEGLASYRRALEIDPANLDNLDQQRALAGR